MALDYGTKRIGVALSDDQGMMAFPHSVIQRTKEYLADITKLAHESDVGVIVVGDSKDYAGNRNPIMKEALECVEALKTLGFEVALEPEILSSHQASHFQGKTDMTDAAAASIILQSYIDRRKN